ncbi:MAG: hypothetical protein WCW31_02525 [Patescibacteria group bacterium]|jgi:hypothetical protein
METSKIWISGIKLEVLPKTPSDDENRAQERLASVDQTMTNEELLCSMRRERDEAERAQNKINDARTAEANRDYRFRVLLQGSRDRYLDKHRK